MVLAAVGAGTGLAAQQPVRVIRLADPAQELPPELLAEMAKQGVAVPGAVVAAEAGDDDTPKAPDPRVQQLQQALLQATFDRRPSAVLEAWRRPEPERIEWAPLPPVEPPAAPVEEDEPAADQGAGDSNDGVEDPTAQIDEAARTAEGEDADPGESPAAEDGEEVVGDGESESVADGEAAAEEDADAGPAEEGSTEQATAEQAAAAKVAAEQAAAAQAAAAEAAKERAEAEAENQKKLVEHVAREIEILQRDVTLGRWDAVRAFFAQFDAEFTKTAFPQFLQKLPNAPRTQPVRNVPPDLVEQNEFSVQDVLGIVALAPGEDGFTEAHVPMLVPMLQRALAAGHTIEGLVADFVAATERPEEERTLAPRRAAQLLAAIGRVDEIGRFLPSLEQAVTDNDREAMNLLARHALALHAEDKKPEQLRAAWDATQAALAAGEIEEDDKTEALGRAVEIAPQLDDEVGDRWLEEGFGAAPERGMEILAAMGAAASRGFETDARDPEKRLRTLKLQSTAVEALLRHAPERAAEWQPTLRILAENWLDEALHSYRNSTATRSGPMMQRDYYGNIFYSPYQSSRNMQAPPIEPDELLEIQPRGRWLELIDADLQPKYSGLVAQLWLKVNEPEEAFPYIERMATVRPELAEDLVSEFLRVWTKNHNPNQQSAYTDPYMFIYGFEERKAAIPLTRSKQERNLKELSEWVSRLRALPLEEIDEKLLVSAFTGCHGVAEVYRLEAIEGVFGDLEQLEPDTLATLIQTMRANLAGVWRKPSTQKDAGTKRKQKDLEAEVLRGYQVANAVMSKALEDHPGNWQLLSAQAAVMHDENEFRADLGNDAEFAGRRLAALERFREAATRYCEAAPDLGEKEWTTDAFDVWFYAGLGACDLGGIDQSTRPETHQPGLIRAALDSMPKAAREFHVGRFANNLFSRLSGVNPAVKVRYLRAGFEIVGDDERAEQAREVFDYYGDLVSELQLVTAVDGDVEVGSDEPFGLRVDLRHTKEIERESGGFGKYLVNQNQSTAFSYNYGRPLEDYRDKFEEAARQALEEQFEVVSVTFNRPDVQSKATAEYGWRRTPYAYLLLKARGPEVDKVPSLRIDLDFLDTSGYAVIPIESAELPIDASSVSGANRPYSEIEITQVLDERESADGKLGLEIRAVAQGLVPELEDLVELEFDDFVVADVEDPGLSVNEFAEDGDGVVSERTFTLKLEPREGLRPEAAKSFRYAAPKDAEVKVAYQRYDDADLREATAVVDLEADYGEPAPVWPWIVGGVVLLALLGGLGFALTRGGSTGPQVAVHALPETLTPFAAVGLLREVRAARAATDPARAEIDADIARIEARYFGEGTGADIDLRATVERWLRARAS